MLVSSSEGRCLDGLVAAILLRAAMIAVVELSLSVGGGGVVAGSLRTEPQVRDPVVGLAFSPIE